MVLAVGLAAAGCTTTNNTNPTPTGSAAAAFAVDSSKCPAAATTALAAGAPIKLGTILPLSGPLAVVGLGVSAGEQAYFKKINAEQGGIDGHQVAFTPKDDAYDPTKTPAAFNDLVQSTGVMAVFGQTGTANAAAVQPLAERTCTPQLWVGTGSPQFGDPTHHAWATLGLAAYSTEAYGWADYIKAKKPGAKVAYLAIDNESGQAYSSAFDAAAAKDGLTVVDKEKHAATATNADTQITKMLAATPDYVIGMTAGSICTQLTLGLAQGAFKGGVIGATSCGTLTSLNAAGAAANGQLTIAFAGRDPLNPADANDPDIITFKADWAKYGNPAVPAAVLSYVMIGYRGAVRMADTVRPAVKLPGGLTNANLMNAAWHIDAKGFATYGGQGKLDGPKDAYFSEYGPWLRYDAATKSLVPTGDVVDAEGKTASYSS
jgi:ABC-type branched-subunit amino acid transport system substrate-binding protein